MYDTQFYKNQQTKSYQSAKHILPFVFEKLNFYPDSVVDFGCGVGTWLQVARESGAREIVGVEGDWVTPEMLRSNNIQLLQRNLEKSIELEKKYDFAVSVEVAEHISEECSDTFIQNLTRSADVILFSAAIKHQGGSHHITNNHSRSG